MSNQTITLTKVYNPLNRADQDTIQWQHRPGSTLADLIDATGSRMGLAGRESLQLAVSVNGQSIPASQWTTTTLVPGQQVVIVPVLTGGGGGSKDVLRIVGMVIIAIVATIVSYGTMTSQTVAAMIGGTAATATTSASMGMVVAGAMAGAMVMVAGSLLMNAVLPPSRPPVPTANGYASIDQSNSYSWNPQNTQQQGIAIPWRYGTCKITGNIIGVYREAIGSSQYINVLVSLGEGILTGISDVKLNGQPIANYRGVELHTRLGYLDQPVIPNFGDTRVEYPQGAKVSYGSPVTYTTIGSAFDALEIEVGFPNGLYYYNDRGELTPFSVNFSIEYRKLGDVAWNLLTTQPGTIQTAESGYWSAGHWDSSGSNMWAGDWSYLPYAMAGVWVEVASGGADPNAHYIGKYYDDYNTWRWSGGNLQVVQTTLQYVTASAAQNGPVRYTYKAWGLDPAKYEIRITRLTADQTDTRYGDDFYLTSVQEIRMDDFTYPGEAVIGLRALATDQLSGSFSFECRTTGKLCQVYRDGGWHVEATENPAWICWDILTQPVLDNNLNVLEYRAHDAASLDLARFYEWSQYCDDLVPDGSGGTEKRLTFNGSIDSAQSMWDVALNVAKIGRATCYWRGTTITVAIDKPAEPVALISVGNIGLDSFEETFLSMENRAGSIEADFLNLEKDLDRDKFTIINPDAPAEWGSASLPLQGVIRPSEVWRHCRYYLATTQALTRVVSLQMDIDSIAFTLGDIIQVQHDVPLWGEGGRIISAISTSVVLDKDVVIESGKQYSIMLRLLDGTVVERTVTNSPATTNTITVSTPFDVVPQQFDVYAFGEVDRSIKPMRVVGIDPAGDLKRKITLTDYNPAVYNADMLQPVLPTINYSSREDLEPVTNLTLSERLVARPDGSIETFMVIAFSPPDNNAWRTGEIWVYGDEWSKAGESMYGSFCMPATDRSTYTVRVVSVDWLGRPLAAADCPVATITIIGKTAPPSDVLRFSKNGPLLHWDAVSDVDVAGYEIRWDPSGGLLWGSSQPMHTGLITTAPWVLPYTPATGALLVKAVDTSGNYSASPAHILLPVTTYSDSNVFDTLALQNNGWPGVTAGGSVTASKIIQDESDPEIWLNDIDSFWRGDTDMFWPGSYGPTIYEFTWTPRKIDRAAFMSAQITVSGNYSLEYRRKTGSAPYQPWHGMTVIEDGGYDFRLTMPAAAAPQHVSELTLMASTEPTTLYFEDLIVSPAGTRLPIGDGWHGVLGVKATLQSDGNGATSVATVDKNHITGPLMRCYSAAGAVTGLIDAEVRVY